MMYVMKLISLLDTGCATLLGPLPCTWGSGWQNARRHLSGDDPKYAKHMDKLYKQFKSLMPNFRILAEIVVKKAALHYAWTARPQFALERTCCYFNVQCP